MNVIAIIPARGGSKGVPGKNIKLIAGKPLISYTIEAALDSVKLKNIIVSSDDEAILKVASSYERVNIHKRSADIAEDTSPVSETVNAILGMFDQNNIDAIMLLQPTAPIRTAENIDAAIALLNNNPEHASVISVVPMDDIHPARMYKLNNNTLEPFISDFEQMRRQEIPVAYYRNGSIYLIRKEAFLRQNSLMAKPICPYIMERKHLCNIDDPRDIIIAEALINAWQEGRL